MSPRVSIRLLPSQSDGRLVELAGRGQEHAFETLVNRYRQPLLRYCRRMGLSDARAEDVLQHSLTKAWLALSQGDQVREVRPWLYRIVHNDAVNSVSRAPVEHEEITEATVASNSSERDLERRMQARDALTHVASLPQMQRSAIVLTAIQGRSHDEAAQALGITDGAVRGLLHRARTTLRSAAAAILSPGLLRWPGRGSGGLGLGERASELSIGAGAVGAGGVLLKGAAITASVGLLALGAGVERSTTRHAMSHDLHTRASTKGPGDAISSAGTVLLSPSTSEVAAVRAIGRVRGHRDTELRRGHRGPRRGDRGSVGEGSSATGRSVGDGRSNDGTDSGRTGDDKAGNGSGGGDLGSGVSGHDGSSSSGSTTGGSGGESIERSSVAEDLSSDQSGGSSGGPQAPADSTQTETSSDGSSGTSGAESGSTRDGTGSTGSDVPGGEAPRSDGHGGD